MRKTRLVAFGIALASVSLMATPAFARDVGKSSDKDALAFVTNCKFDHVGERCLVYGIFALDHRELFNGVVTFRSTSLELDKYRITVLDSLGSVDVKFVAAGFGQNVSLNIADDLTSASGSASVGNVVGGRIGVSFALNGIPPTFSSSSKQVFKIGNCRPEIDRFNGKTRFGDTASAVIDGRAFAWTDILSVGGAPVPEIDKAHSTSIFNDCVV